MTTRELVWNAMFAADMSHRYFLSRAASKVNARVLMQCHEAAARVVRHA